MGKTRMSITVDMTQDEFECDSCGEVAIGVSFVTIEGREICLDCEQELRSAFV